MKNAMEKSLSSEDIAKINGLSPLPVEFDVRFLDIVLNGPVVSGEENQNAINLLCSLVGKGFEIVSAVGAGSSIGVKVAYVLRKPL